MDVQRLDDRALHNLQGNEARESRWGHSYGDSVCVGCHSFLISRIDCWCCRRGCSGIGGRGAECRNHGLNIRHYDDLRERGGTVDSRDDAASERVGRRDRSCFFRKGHCAL